MQEITLKNTNKLLFVAVGIQIVFLLVGIISYNFTYSPKIIIMVVIGIVALGSTLFSIEKTFFLLVAYLSILPAESSLKQCLPSLPDWYWYSNKIGFALLIAILVYWFLWESIKREKIVFTSFDWALLSFIVISLFSAVIGILYKHSLTFWIVDFIPLIFYLGYFIYVNSSLKTKDPKILFDLIVISSVFIGLEHLYEIKMGGMHRIQTEHIHLAQLSIPYIGATLVFSSSFKRKLLFTIAIPIILSGVIISMQRALWGTIGVSTLFFLCLMGIRKKFRLFLISILLGLIMFWGTNVITYNQWKNKSEIIKNIFLGRATLLFNPELLSRDISWITRTGEIRIALDKPLMDKIIGRGLGDWYVEKTTNSILGTVDNTYVFILWKLGILGLISYLIVLFIFLKRCLFILKITKDENEKIYSITSLVNMLGMTIIGITNCCLAHYRFILVWAATFGIIELISRKYRYEEIY